MKLPPDEIEAIKSEEITDVEEDDSYSTTTEQYSEVEQTENVFNFEEVNATDITATEVNINENLIKTDLVSQFKKIFNNEVIGDSASEPSIVSNTKSSESDSLALYVNSGFNTKSIINNDDEDDICEDDNLTGNRNIVITDSPVSVGVTQSSLGTSGFTIPTQVVTSTTTPIDDRSSSDRVNIINNLGIVENPETTSASTVKFEDQNFYFTSKKEDVKGNLPEATTIISGEEVITAQEVANRIGSTESTVESFRSFTIKPDQDIGVDITNARTLKYEENNRNPITNSFPQANFASFGQKKLFTNGFNQRTFGYNGFNSFNPEIGTTTGLNFAITPGYNQGLATVSTVKPSIVEPTISTYTSSTETTLDLNPSSQYDLFNGIQTTLPTESKIAEEIEKPKIELFSKTGDQVPKLPIQDGLANTILPPKKGK